MLSRPLLPSQPEGAPKTTLFQYMDTMDSSPSAAVYSTQNKKAREGIRCNDVSTSDRHTRSLDTEPHLPYIKHRCCLVSMHKVSARHINNAVAIGPAIGHVQGKRQSDSCIYFVRLIHHV